MAAPAEPRHRLNRVPAALLALALVAAVAAAGCVAPPPGTRYLDPTFGVTVRRGIVYGHAVDFHGNPVDLLLDLYLPAGDTATDRPAIVYAHGGGFVTGDRSSAGFAPDLARRGYVTASIDYRLRPGEDISFGNPNNPQAIDAVVDAIHDAQTAIRWMRAHAGELGIDPARVGFGGSSAGAVMAVGISMLSGSVDTSEGQPGYSSRSCLSIVDAGALLPGLAGPDDTPAVFFHGTADTTVPYALGLQTEQALAAAGVPAAFFTYQGVGHVVPIPDLLPTLVPIVKAQVADGDCARWL